MIGFAPYSISSIAWVLLKTPVQTLRCLPEVIRGEPGIFLALPRAVIERVQVEWHDYFKKPDASDDFLKNLRR